MQSKLEVDLAAFANDLRQRASISRKQAVDPNVAKKQNPFWAPQIDIRIYTALELLVLAEQAE